MLYLTQYVKYTNINRNINILLFHIDSPKCDIYFTQPISNLTSHLQNVQCPFCGQGYCSGNVQVENAFENKGWGSTGKAFVVDLEDNSGLKLKRLRNRFQRYESQDSALNNFEWLRLLWDGEVRKEGSWLSGHSWGLSGRTAYLFSSPLVWMDNWSLRVKTTVVSLPWSQMWSSKF